MESAILKIKNTKYIKEEKHMKYKNFRPIDIEKKIEDKKNKETNIILLVLLILNLYLLPLNVEKSIENKNIKNDVNLINNKSDSKLKLLSFLNDLGIEEYNINNNLINITVNLGKEDMVLGALEENHLELKEIIYGENKIDIKVEMIS